VPGRWLRLAPVAPGRRLRTAAVPGWPRGLAAGRPAARRLASLYAGIVLFGVSVALMIAARLGLDPWDVFHQGLARRTGLPIGWIVNGTGAASGVCCAVMTWTWQLESADGTVLSARGLPVETFPSQSDAESWLGENWRSLLAAGVDQVTLLEDGRTEYGPMSLQPEE